MRGQGKDESGALHLRALTATSQLLFVSEAAAVAGASAVLMELAQRGAAVQKAGRRAAGGRRQWCSCKGESDADFQGHLHVETRHLPAQAFTRP